MTYYVIKAILRPKDNSTAANPPTSKLPEVDLETRICTQVVYLVGARGASGGCCWQEVGKWPREGR